MTAYLRPDSVSSALALLAEVASVALAGGATLVPQLHEGMQATAVVDLSAISELRGIDASEQAATVTLDIGAMSSLAAVLRAAAAVPPLLGLAEALHTMGTPLIRQRATIGGALAVAAPHLQWAAVVACLDTRVRLETSTWARVVDGVDLYGRRSCSAHELITSVRLSCPSSSGTAFERSGGSSIGRHIAFACALVETDPDGRCVRARLGFATAGHEPKRMEATDLVGSRLSDADIARAAHLAVTPIRTCDDAHATAGYRRHALEVLARRALRRAADRALDRAGPTTRTIESRPE
ncbi:FAD binding domain-containing protein [Microbacteriaceae bacterium VKM Ac-2854]|nr:FAD binding domain-containing protein [Microbacteriaceae bacterium VKM Ac-2854]